MTAPWLDGSPSGTAGIFPCPVHIPFRFYDGGIRIAHFRQIPCCYRSPHLPIGSRPVPLGDEFLTFRRQLNTICTARFRQIPGFHKIRHVRDRRSALSYRFLVLEAQHRAVRMGSFRLRNSETDACRNQQNCCRNHPNRGCLHFLLPPSQGESPGSVRSVKQQLLFPTILHQQIGKTSDRFFLASHPAVFSPPLLPRGGC